MKYLFAATLVSVALFITHKADSQELPGCFMVSPSGQLVNLNAICQSSPAQPQATRDSSGRLPLETVIDNAISLNVNTYCEGRARGLNQDEAYRAGQTDFAEYVIDQGYTIQDVNVTPAFVLSINNLIGDTCPDYAIDYSL